MQVLELWSLKLFKLASIFQIPLAYFFYKFLLFSVLITARIWTTSAAAVPAFHDTIDVPLVVRKPQRSKEQVNKKMMKRLF